ncbi:MAG TPA: TIGR03619 family F420-dependent LLM class oxidoreductase [Actinocrinis sp.]|nr:TIGR03619 family F420-dependent LLM class oxidoreductase [Actinocrinis sp.]
MTTLFAPADRPPSLGLFGLNGGELVPSPAEMLRLAVLAEQLGFESVWMGEHPVLPAHPGADSPFPPAYPLSDALISLAQVAAVTSRVRLGTGIAVLPLHHPVLLAKQLATIDHSSGGRMTLGFGMGYLRGQAAAFEVDFATRNARGLEYLEAVHAILASPESASYHGRFVDFGPVESFPRAAQSSLDTVAGGHSRTAFRSALTHAHGWYGFGLGPAAVRGALAQIGQLAESVPRPAHLGPLTVSVTPPRGPVTAEQAEQYREAGVHRLVVWPPAGSDVEEFVRFQAKALELTEV